MKILSVLCIFLFLALSADCYFVSMAQEKIRKSVDPEVEMELMKIFGLMTRVVEEIRAKIKPATVEFDNKVKANLGQTFTQLADKIDSMSASLKA
ncbi:hypothetical protein Ciccas_006127 [Cichlidogyrus casuarinus]|uniref:Uncharacterized protein n=1 Tax=Cichlidogyrus casuarinus TaxID=1844966 RepID=A0ABD2Q7Q2_9PLAT